MTALLYNSISSGLTEDEIIEIDRKVRNNRKGVYLFVRNLPSNSKRKSKRVFLYGMFIFQLGQALVPYAAAVMVPLPPQISIERSVTKQGKKLGFKIKNQLNYWFNPENTDRPKVTLPENRSKVLVVNDLFDVPVSEKQQMESSIKVGLKGAHPILFINNRINR